MSKPRRRSDLETYAWRKLRLVILKRDGYVCQLCGRDIDRLAKPCTPWAPSVDHIVPPEIAPHLRYEPSNLRAAHFHCNSSRKQGDRPTSRASRAW